MDKISELNKKLSGHEVMIIGDHKWAGTVGKFVTVVKTDKLRIHVKTPWQNDIFIEPKNAYITTLKQQPKWN